MTWYTFDSMIAIDETTNLPAIGAVGYVYALTDTARVTPLPTTDLGGVSLSTITVGPLGYTPGFQVENLLSVVWKSGTNEQVLLSQEGLLAELAASVTAAQQAQTAATQAKTAALGAQAAAEDAVRTGGGGAGFGSTVDRWWDGTGVEPDRVFPAGHPAEGSIIPVWMVVTWAQPTYPVHAQPHDIWDETP